MGEEAAALVVLAYTNKGETATLVNRVHEHLLTSDYTLGQSLLPQLIIPPSLF